MLKLSKELSQDKPDWKNSHVLMMDNCSIHKTLFMRKLMETAGFTVLFTAPGSYLVSPVEGVFALIKQMNFSEIKTPIFPET